MIFWKEILFKVQRGGKYELVKGKTVIVKKDDIFEEEEENDEENEQEDEEDEEEDGEEPASPDTPDEKHAKIRRILKDDAEIPAPRSGASCIYFASQSETPFNEIEGSPDKIVIVAGYGEDTTRFSDIWKLDTIDYSWKKVHTPKKNAVANYSNEFTGHVGHSTCYFKDRNSLIVFGGRDDNFEIQNHVFEYQFDHDRWTLLFPRTAEDEVLDAPARRVTHSAVIFEQGLYVFGGVDSMKTYNDLWRFDLNKCTWSRVTYRGDQITSRERHSAIFDPSRTAMIVFGGFSSGAVDSVPDPRSAPSSPTTPPSSKSNQFSFADRMRGVFRSDIFILNLRTLVCKRVVCTKRFPLPGGIRSHSAVLTNDYKFMIVFGGRDETQHDHSEIFSFEFETNKWKVISKVPGEPYPRARHCACMQKNNKMIVWSGNVDDDKISNQGYACFFSSLSRDISNLFDP